MACFKLAELSSAALLSSSSSSPSASTRSSPHPFLSCLSFSSAHFYSLCSFCSSLKLPTKNHLRSLHTRSTLPLIRASSSNGFKEAVPPPRSVSVILLAGGRGKRMGASMPKQYLPLLGQPIALYSFQTFAKMKEVHEIVVVCDPSYRDIFEEAGKREPSVELKFALPGKERQFSVLNGLKEICGTARLACIHDSARPLVLTKDIYKVMCDAYVHGAAVLGVPVKGTIKEAKTDNFVARTLDRSLLWEMQTPQVIEPSLLQKGFDLVEQKNLEVTDDVSIVEHLSHPVFITEGSYTNIKVTTPDDMIVAERILHQGEQKGNS